jgi:hypothetical protein
MVPSSFFLLASLLWLAYRLLLNFLGIAGIPTISGHLPVAGNPAVACVSAVAKGQVYTLFPIFHMVMVLFQKETSFNK